VVAYLVTAARIQVDEAAEYAPMRLITAAQRLAELLARDAPGTPAAPGSPASATDVLVAELRSVEPTATPTRDRDRYTARLDRLCELVADALLDQPSATDGAVAEEDGR
jgi:hypothetical protein